MDTENGKAIISKKKRESNDKHGHRDMAVAPWQKLALPLQESQVGLTGRNPILHKATKRKRGPVALRLLAFYKQGCWYDYWW